MLFFNDKKQSKVHVNKKQIFALSVIPVSLIAVIIFLFLYAFIAITIKLYAIKENSSFHLLSIITYISTSYVLHDFIQIRVSCAIAIFLYSIKFLNNKKNTQNNTIKEDGATVSDKKEENVKNIITSLFYTTFLKSASIIF